MKVSVILTSYNHAKFLRESIESVLSQTYKNYELIIVDDCSEDESWNIIKEYTDERIIAIRNPRNLRTAGTYNAFMNVAKGEYIAVHHSDDVWEATKLEKEVAYLDNNKVVAAVFTHVNVIDEDGKLYTDKDGFYHNIFEQPNRDRYEWLNHFFYKGNALCHPSILMRRELFFEQNLFDFGMAQIPDLARWVKICLRHEIYIIPEKLTRFRIRKEGKNTSGSRADTVVRSSIELFHFLKLYLNISTKEEFLRVFPDAQEYVSGEYFNIKYALARICTRHEMDSYTRLFGYELLYDLMNDRDAAKLIEKEYGYTFRDLINETGTRDIFHVLPKKSNQTATIYFDYGNGFSEEDSCKLDYFLPEHYVFEKEIVLKKSKKEQNVVKLRFDPAEEIRCKCSEIKIWLDGKEINVNPYNSFFRDNGYEIFLNIDPIYISEELNCQISTLRISGEIQRLSDASVENVLNLYQEKIENVILIKDNQYDKAQNQVLLNEKQIIEMQETLRANEKKMLEMQEDLLLNEKMISEMKDLLQKEDNKQKILLDELNDIKSGKSKLRRECALCGHKFVHYRPLDRFYIEEAARHGYPKSNPETLNREEYECPLCYGLDRDRLCAIFMSQIMKKGEIKPIFMLDIAPSVPFSRFIQREFANIIYHTTDLFMDGTTYRMDIQEMNKIKDETYDIFMCCHVLEHVQSDIKAMKELYRILNQNGVGILLIPLDLNQTETDEEWGCSAEENWRRFGQGDHVRKYNKDDFIKRLESVGFFVYQLGEKYFGTRIFEKNALTKTSTLYVVTKRKVTKEKLVSYFRRKNKLETKATPDMFYKYYQDTTGRLKAWIDEFSYKDGRLSICGWAFLEQTDSRLTTLKIALVGEAAVILLGSDLIIREDIEETFNEKKDGRYKKSGIQFEYYIGNIVKGEYKVVLALQNENIFESYYTEYTVSNTF